MSTLSYHLPEFAIGAVTGVATLSARVTIRSSRDQAAESTAQSRPWSGRTGKRRRPRRRPPGTTASLQSSRAMQRSGNGYGRFPPTWRLPVAPRPGLHGLTEPSPVTDLSRCDRANHTICSSSLTFHTMT